MSRSKATGYFVPVVPQVVTVTTDEVLEQANVVILAAQRDDYASRDLQILIRDLDVSTLVAAVTFGLVDTVQRFVLAFGPRLAELTPGNHPVIVALMHNQLAILEQVWSAPLNYEVLTSSMFWLVLRAPQLILEAISRIPSVRIPDGTSVRRVIADAVYDALEYAFKLNPAALPYFDPFIGVVDPGFDETRQPLDFEWEVRHIFGSIQIADYIRTRRVQLRVTQADLNFGPVVSVTGSRRQLSPSSPVEGFDQQGRPTQRQRRNEDEM